MKKDNISENEKKTLKNKKKTKIKMSFYTFQNLDCLIPIQIYKTIEIKVYTTSTKVNELNDSLHIYHDYLLNVVKSNDRILLKR